MKIFVVKAVIEGENECVLMGAYPTLTEANKKVEELTKKYKQDKETRYTTEQTELTNF
ncbi:hypothetical protein SAMN04487922_13441 [Bacillus toyonensis]|uniref:hypothetical protein n=1 Tax=Bacillus toyonensis TaxID=155322 RepID=UPI000889E228|nr:hypothetical protein [Bacillus toyonensis]SDL44310.1 hypothetical protein SAMN04487922_13441 [Bacillus toyonensis]